MNENSFKVLQQALRNLGQSIEDPHVAQSLAKPIDLAFFFHCEESQALKRTSVTLFRDNLAGALSDLFESLSLPPPPINTLPRSRLSRFADGPSPSGRPGSREVTLTEIVRLARAAGMASMKSAKKGGEAAARAAEWTQRDSNLRRLVLQRLRGVTIVNGFGLPERDGEAPGVGRLGAILQQNQDIALGGLRIVIDGGRDTSLNSPRATLNLGIYASDTLWTEAIRSDACLVVAEERRALGQCERTAAKSAGLAHVLFQEDAEGNAPESSEARSDVFFRRSVDTDVAHGDYMAYKELLSSLTSLKSAVSPGTSNLSLILIGSSLQNERPVGLHADPVKGWDANEGVMRVFVRASFAQLVEAVRLRGERVAAQHAIIRDRQEAERRRVWRVARALRIDSLRRGEGVTQLQWSRALDDLVADAGRLGGILDRSAVVVGRDSRLLPDTGEVQLSWDFKHNLKL